MIAEAPCVGALAMVDRLVQRVSTAGRSPQSTAGDDGDHVDRLERSLWRRLRRPGRDESTAVVLIMPALEVLARGEGNPFTSLVEADEPIVEQYQWFKATDQDAMAVRMLAARCLATVAPELCDE